MGDKDLHFKKLEKMYLEARVNKEHYSSTNIIIGPGKARVDFQVDSSFHHALGGMHGSVYFKLLDDASFFAVNSLVRDRFVLTTSFNINMVRPFSKGNIHAIGKVRFRSKELYTAESTLFNENGRELAFGMGNFAKSKVALADVEGYG